MAMSSRISILSANQPADHTRIVLENRDGIAAYCRAYAKPAIGRVSLFELWRTGRPTRWLLRPTPFYAACAMYISDMTTAEDIEKNATKFQF